MTENFDWPEKIELKDGTRRRWKNYSNRFYVGYALITEKEDTEGPQPLSISPHVLYFEPDDVTVLHPCSNPNPREGFERITVRSGQLVEKFKTEGNKKEYNVTPNIDSLKTELEALPDTIKGLLGAAYDTSGKLRNLSGDRVRALQRIDEQIS